MMALAGDLPQLESRAQFESAENSIVYDINGEKIATLTNNQGRILVGSADIAPVMKEAVVAIEDQRFYEHRGIDYEGIGRAVFQDILSMGATQGGSTITQQFVKNALRAQGSRTVFGKLREAALAYQLERNWDKDKILTEYLNEIYFGGGAYGIEAAASTFFGWNHPGCGEPGSRCASQLLPWEAAMLAGMISNPSGFDPTVAPDTSTARRNLVLQKMAEQGYIAPEEAERYSQEDPPAPSEIKTPEEDSRAPYFTSWLRQQLVDKYGAGEAFGGGLHVSSTLDLALQEDTQEIAYSRTAGVGLSSAVVVLDNVTGGVRAMVGGYDYREQPFNLATQGQRQPGSAFKPFTLVTALEQGISSDTVYSSAPKELPFKIPGVKAPQLFEVNNYEDSYLGSASIATATTYSDNSVYAELGLQVGTENIAETARAMGIETPISTNPAMILGGLEQGVTPLNMAHAFQTLAHDGQRVSGTMAPTDGAPIAIQKVSDEAPGEGGDVIETNDGDPGQDRVETEQVISPEIAAQARSILATVVSQGTGTNASTGATVEWGKTGTTENNGDAWFVGATEDVTIAVWVGHANSVKPMETEFGGAPVDGGTIPALIFHDVVLAFEQLSPDRPADEESTTDTPATASPTAPAPAPAPTEPAPSETEGGSQAPPAESPPSGGGTSGGTGGGVAPG
ncbi:MAG TPA: transglycosylase domain-containing protein [Solirubrobacterales bacterium]|nr:transglycosylase domain-containing protein [Solirubrobacterales bacterium]